MKRQLNWICGFLLTLLISGCDGCGTGPMTPCECEADRSTEQNYVANAGSSSGSWSTYDYAGGTFTADAACHTIMKVSFFWLDPERAATDEVPPIIPSFDNSYGYFAPQSEPYRTSIYVGDVNVSAWEYSTNQAADASSPGAINYSVSWTYDTNYQPAGDVHVQTRIAFDEYDANQYDRNPKEPCAK